MGQAALILSVLLAVLVAGFAVQNAGPVTLRFGFWSVETSLVVVILVAVVAGVFMTVLVGFPGWIRNRRRLRAQAREIESLRSAPPLPPLRSGSSPRPLA